MRSVGNDILLPRGPEHLLGRPYLVPQPFRLVDEAATNFWKYVLQRIWALLQNDTSKNGADPIRVISKRASCAGNDLEDVAALLPKSCSSHTME